MIKNACFSYRNCRGGGGGGEEVRHGSEKGNSQWTGGGRNWKGGGLRKNA